MRIWPLFSRRYRDQDLDEEIRAHQAHGHARSDRLARPTASSSPNEERNRERPN